MAVRQMLMVILSAVMLPLCFPPYGWWPLIIAVYALLLSAVADTTPRRAFWLGMLQGTLGFGLTLYWLYYLFSFGAFSLYALMAIFIALFCLLFNLFLVRIKSVWLVVPVAAVLWTAIEFYRSELFFLRFPWITAGSAVGPTFLSPILGVYGMSFFVIVAAACFVRRKTVPFGIVAVIFVLALGFLRPPPIEPDAAKSITVAVVQNDTGYAAAYRSLSRTLSESHPDLIVWPECALPYYVRQSPSTMALVTNLCAEMNTILVFGTKTQVGSGVEDWYNTALVVGKAGVIGEYYKARPVHFFNDGIPGRKFEPVKTALGPVGTPICFDCDYTEIVRRIAAAGAKFFAVPSFDARAWSVNQHLQHALMFRLRAAESGRWLACAASSGVSQIIDPGGNVHASIPAMKEGTAVYRIEPLDHKTFFVRIGWLFPWLTVAATAALLLYALVNRLLVCQRQPL